jgi:Undecaprenyl-phosphate galactose phosphotransferase WbaP
MAMTQPGVPAKAKLRFSPMTCALSLSAADGLAVTLCIMIVAIACGLLPKMIEPSDAFVHFASFRDVAVLYAGTIAYLAFNGRYNQRVPFWTEMKLIFHASFWAVAAELVVAILDRDILDRVPTMAVLTLFPIVATFANAMTKYLLSKAGVWTLSIVLVGEGASAIAAEAALASDPGLGFEVVGRVDPVELMVRRGGPLLWPLIDRFRADRILFALDGDKTFQRTLIESALRERIPFAIAPEAHALPAAAWEATRFFSHDVVMLSFRHGASRTLAQVVKTILDVSAALILLILTSPIFLVVAIMNWRSGGPMFFAHRRLGIGGQSFPCLKFRTMVVDGDRVLQEALANDPALAAEWEATQKLRRDPRVTPIGRFLRKTSLDELPQLINVLLRQMSLVGPRPIVENEARFYGEDIAHYYGTRPGVTGLWQVSGRSNTTYARRVQLDVWYVNNWTVWLDIAVLLKTFPAVLGRSGAH